MSQSDEHVVSVAEVREALEALAQHQRLEPLQTLLRTRSDLLQTHSEQLLGSVLALCTSRAPADTAFARLNLTWKVLLTLLTSPSLSTARYVEGVQYMFAQLRWAIAGHDWREPRLVKLSAFIASHTSSAIRSQAGRFILQCITCHTNSSERSLVVQLMALYRLANGTVACTLQSYDAARALYEAVVLRLDVVLHALGAACAARPRDNDKSVGKADRDVYRVYRSLIDLCVTPTPQRSARNAERAVHVLSALAAQLGLVQGFTQTMVKQHTDASSSASSASTLASSAEGVHEVTAWTLRVLFYWLPGMSLCDAAEAGTQHNITSKEASCDEKGNTLQRICDMAHDLPPSVWLTDRTSHEGHTSSTFSEGPRERWLRCVSDLLFVYCTLPSTTPPSPNAGGTPCHNTKDDDRVMTCVVTALSGPHGRVGVLVLHACLAAAQRIHEAYTRTSLRVPFGACKAMYCVQQLLQLGRMMWRAIIAAQGMPPTTSNTPHPAAASSSSQKRKNGQDKQNNSTCNNNTNSSEEEDDDVERWWAAWHAMSAAKLAVLLGVVCVLVTRTLPSVVVQRMEASTAVSTSLACRDANVLQADSTDKGQAQNSCTADTAVEKAKRAEDGFVCLADFAAVLYLQTLPPSERTTPTGTTSTGAASQTSNISSDELVSRLQALMEGVWSRYKPTTTHTPTNTAAAAVVCSDEAGAVPASQQTGSQPAALTPATLHQTFAVMHDCVHILYTLQQLRQSHMNSTTTNNVACDAYTTAIRSLARPLAALTRALQAIASSQTTSTSSAGMCERLVGRLCAAALLREAAYFTFTEAQASAADGALLACVRRWVDLAFDICPGSLAHVAVRRPRCDLAALSTGHAAHTTRDEQANEESTEANNSNNNNNNKNEKEEEENESMDQARLQDALGDITSYYATEALLYLVEHNTALPMDKLSLSEVSAKLLMRLLQNINQGNTDNGEQKASEDEEAARLRRSDERRFAHTEKMWHACLEQSKARSYTNTEGDEGRDIHYKYTGRTESEALSAAVLVQQWWQCTQSLRRVSAFMTKKEEKKEAEETQQRKAADKREQQQDVGDDDSSRTDKRARREDEQCDDTTHNTRRYDAEEMRAMCEAVKTLLTSAQQTQKCLTEAMAAPCNTDTKGVPPATTPSQQPVIEVD